MKNIYGRIITLIITLMLVMLTLPACSSGEEATEPEIAEEPPVAEEMEQEENDDAVTEAPEDGAAYEVDRIYVLKVPLRVREEPSVDSRQKKRSELAESDMIKASTGEDALIKAGALVNCLEVSGDWMRIDSGWICCREGSEVYITEPVLLAPPEGEDWRYDKGFYYDEQGEKFYITETEKGLTGTYNYSGNSNDSIEFYSDGTCMYHTDDIMWPQTDENGYCDGNYNYRNGKVYFRLGGTVSVEVYTIEGRELVRQ